MGPFSINLFASRTNTQLPIYCSWRPDPEALAVNAFSIRWASHRVYMFPPFALIPRCLNHLNTERVSALLIAPVWPNQIWFPKLLVSLIDYPVLLPPLPDIVCNSVGQRHPLAVEGHLPLAAWFVLGDPAPHRVFQSELPRSFDDLGEHRHRRTQLTAMPGDSGLAGGVWNGKQIHF